MNGEKERPGKSESESEMREKRELVESQDRFWARAVKLGKCEVSTEWVWQALLSPDWPAYSFAGLAEPFYLITCLDCTIWRLTLPFSRYYCWFILADQFLSSISLTMHPSNWLQDPWSSAFLYRCKKREEEEEGIPSFTGGPATRACQVAKVHLKTVWNTTLDVP